MRASFVLTLMFGLVVSFQNCSQKRATQDDVHSGPGGAAMVQKQYDLSLASSMEITNPGYSGLLAKSDSASSLPQQNPEISYLVDLGTGQIEEQNEVSGTSELKYCLTSDELKEVKDILYSSAVCKALAVAEMDSSRVCTMIYKAPYAVINFPAKDGVELGEQRSGCDLGTDLCGQQSSMLKGFLVHILQNLSSHSCNP